jgi:hypothetical protein
MPLIVVFVFAACDQKHEPADSDSQAAQRTDSDQAPATGETSAATAALVWTAPDGWVEEEPGSAMRLAQYRLPKSSGDMEDATAAVFHFRGAGGSVQANLDRWYSQFIQPDGRLSAEVAEVKTAERNGLKQTTVDLSGTFLQSTTPMGPQSEEKPNYRMLAGVIETPSGPWFIKITGPGKTVAHWEKSFYDFMASVKPGAL